MEEAKPAVKYNYDSFIRENFEPHMRFHESPPLGETAPDFPLWTLEGEETSLGEVCARNAFTVVEFGSFT
jgi:hypothetical protein